MIIVHAVKSGRVMARAAALFMAVLYRGGGYCPCRAAYGCTLSQFMNCERSSESRRELQTEIPVQGGKWNTN